MFKKIVISIIILFAVYLVAWSAVPTTLNDFFLPGSQPNESGNLETPSKCDNCHGGYDIDVEPAFIWRGSMMSQAARDPLYFASVTIANQDAPESGDLCLRCHSPAGWLEGRSIPTDGSALNNNDREGVQCDFCHKLVKPVALGDNPYPDDPDYNVETYAGDQAYLATITEIPPVEANGMYVCDADNAKRGPFVDANSTHQKFYSPFHAEAEICATCHDVSNPAFSRDGGKYVPNDFDLQAPDFNPYEMFPVERTFSEWKMSDYNSAAGVYAPQFGGNLDTVRTCQDCHMRDVTGKGCNKASAPVRTDLPLHDQTGGNTFIPLLLETLYPGEVDQDALDSGIVRANYMLQTAATMQVTTESEDTSHSVNVHIINETGHKLPSGYPEGRRIWINVQAFDINDSIIYESGAYDTSTAVLTHDADAKIYEIKPGISSSLSPVVGLPIGPSFHFVLNDTIFSDNRIPPRGFTNTNFEMIQSPPVDYFYPDGQYWDDTEYEIPGASAKLVVNLFYQTTSKEYVEFLRDENITDDWGTTLYNLWSSNGKSVPVVMNTDTLQLTPLNINYPPVLDSIGPKLVNENENLNFTVSATDPDGTTPLLTASGLPTGAEFEDQNDGTGIFNWTPGYDQAGIYNVTFIATDEEEAADSETVVIEVINVNRPPSLDPISDQSVDEGENLTFNIAASDPDDDALSFSVDPVLTNSSLTDNGNDTAVYEFNPDYIQAGEYTLIFTVTDSDLTDQDTVLITVLNTNRLPSLDPIGSHVVQVDSNLIFDVTASDPDNDSLILSTSTLPTGASFNDNGDGSGNFDWTPSSDQTGTHFVIFYCEDIHQAVDSELVEISVYSQNLPPVLDPIGDKSGNVSELLTFIVTATDPNDDSVFIAADNLPTGAIFDYTGWDDDLQKYAGTFSWTPSQFQSGVFDSIHFYADDGQFTDDEFINITISDQAYLCGDANNDNLVNISDAVYLVNYVFIGGNPPEPLEAGEVNCDQAVNISDAVFIVNYIFIPGSPEPCDPSGDGIPDC